MAPALHACFAVTAPGLEHLAAGELAGLGLAGIPEAGGVSFEATTRALYAANLELRTASRIVVRLARFPARAFYELERKARRVPWETIVAPGRPVRFRVTSRKSRLYHLDGIAERLQGAVGGGGLAPGGAIPGDDLDEDDTAPAAQLFVVRVMRDVVTISADSSGELLHRRGYRLATAKAPLRETLAAAMLLGAEFREGMPMADPFCGSGTLPIEAAMLSRRMAPGLARRFGFETWPSFEARAWDAVRGEALARVRPAAGAPIVGSDRDAGAITSAGANAARAGVAGDIAFEVAAVSAVNPPAHAGWLVTNPPYGIRVGDRENLRDLYESLGDLFRRRWSGWTIALLSADRALLARTGLGFTTAWTASNGGIPVELVRADGSGAG